MFFDDDDEWIFYLILDLFMEILKFLLIGVVLVGFFLFLKEIMVGVVIVRILLVEF